MKIIERFADEVEPGEIVMIANYAYPVISVFKDIYGTVQFELCQKLNDDGVSGLAFELSLLVNDTLFVCLEEDEEELELEDER